METAGIFFFSEHSEIQRAKPGKPPHDQRLAPQFIEWPGGATAGHLFTFWPWVLGPGRSE
jgi:hypothetical protein